MVVHQAVRETQPSLGSEDARKERQIAATIESRRGRSAVGRCRARRHGGRPLRRPRRRSARPGHTRQRLQTRGTRPYNPQPPSRGSDPSSQKRVRPLPRAGRPPPSARVRPCAWRSPASATLNHPRRVRPLPRTLVSPSTGSDPFRRARAPHEPLLTACSTGCASRRGTARGPVPELVAAADALAPAPALDLGPRHRRAGGLPRSPGRQVTRSTPCRALSRPRASGRRRRASRADFRRGDAAEARAARDRRRRAGLRPRLLPRPVGRPARRLRARGGRGDAPGRGPAADVVPAPDRTRRPPRSHARRDAALLRGAVAGSRPRSRRNEPPPNARVARARPTWYRFERS